ncbi:MAG: 5'-deoxynucleotidase YfbR-like HD superfamily hydrolase [Candidatus Paceibacteria bacterium]|jgi:5'-deoxynucleotidase YfbR-like HD superfamily hydrolase
MGNTTTSNSKIPQLKYAHLSPQTWTALAELPREGWKRRNVQDPESVQDHTISLRELGFGFFDLMSFEEKNGLLDMLEIHDWPESKEGDEVTVSETEETEKELKADKRIREENAMNSICKPLGEKGKVILSLWLRFEDSDDPAASFARQLDKYQAIEKALEYEEAQKIPLFHEFLSHARSRNQVTHPLLLERLSELEKEWTDNK